MSDEKHLEIAKLGYRQAIIVALIGAIPAAIGTLAATGYFTDEQDASRTQIRNLQQALDDSHEDVARLESQRTSHVEKIENLESEKAQLQRNLNAAPKRYPNVDGTWKNAKGAIRTIKQYGNTGECLVITEGDLRYRGWFDDKLTVRASPDELIARAQAPTGERYVGTLGKAGTEIAWNHGKPWSR